LEFTKDNDIVTMNATDSSYSPSILDGLDKDYQRIEKILYGLDYVKTTDADEIELTVMRINKNTKQFIKENVASDTIEISEIIKNIDNYKNKTIIIKEIICLSTEEGL
jgi:hypothetical protein